MNLSLQNITHSYGDLSVLDDVSLDIPAGQIVCVIGPSGCGKSTLLRLIGGLEKPDAGQILQLGTPPDGCLNPLTYVFQDFALLPWRDVVGNISLVLEDHGLSPVDRSKIIDDVLLRTKLSEFRKALPPAIVRRHETTSGYRPGIGRESGGHAAR